MSTILGFSCFYHDSAASIIRDGEIIAAAQEERFTRLKHDAKFPINAIKYVLEEANQSIDEIDGLSSRLISKIFPSRPISISSN